MNIYWVKDFQIINNIPMENVSKNSQVKAQLSLRKAIDTSRTKGGKNVCGELEL